MVIISEEVVNAGERVQELDKGDDDERRTQPVMRSGRSRRILGGTHRAPQCAGMYQFFNDSRQHHGTPRVRHMTDWGTVLLLIPSALFPLAMVALVLWPMFAGVREISKAIRSVRKKPTRFILTNDGATIWSADSRRAMSQTVPVGDKRPRLTVLVVCAMEAAFIVFLTVFLFQHANCLHVDLLPLTLPAFILARHGRWLVFSAGLAALAAVAYFAFWLETVSELGLPKS
jgi:hypothetical protein